jgi:transcription initiation factor IIE alpha subunit
MELTTTQFQEVVMSVRADDIAEACAAFLAITSDLDSAVVIYDAILNQMPEYTDEGGYINNMEGLKEGVNNRLKFLVNDTTK